MTDIDGCGTDVAKAAVARTQAEIDIFQIAALKTFRQSADGIETIAGDVEAEADAARRIDDGRRIGGRGGLIKCDHLLIAWHRVVDAGLREGEHVAVVRKRR